MKSFVKNSVPIPILSLKPNLRGHHRQPDYFKTGLVRNLFQSDILSVQKNKLIKLTLILALIIWGAGISYLIMTFHFRHMVSFTAASTEPIREWWAQQVQSTESKNSSTAQEKYWIHFLSPSCGCSKKVFEFLIDRADQMLIDRADQKKITRVSFKS